MKQRLLLIPLIVSLWLALACSDDRAAMPAAASPAASTTASAAATQQVRAQVAIDFTGAPRQRENESLSLRVAPGTKAWDAIKQSLGSNVSSRDFGGNLGIFVTGFYGIEAQGNHFWEFGVNGKPADEGVSSYVVKDGDRLEFRYASY